MSYDYTYYLYFQYSSEMIPNYIHDIQQTTLGCSAQTGSFSTLATQNFEYNKV